LDIVITVDNNNLRYELFNHWYSWSYAEYRQITVPLDSLETFNQQNDSIQIQLLGNKVKVADKRYRLNRKFKQLNLCASAETMRKISFAYQLSSEHNNIRHFELYKREDLKLPKEEFERKVTEKLKEKIR